VKIRKRRKINQLMKRFDRNLDGTSEDKIYELLSIARKTKKLKPVIGSTQDVEKIKKRSA
jgi:hypothetical protein